jgi:hypothetical protein
MVCLFGGEVGVVCRSIWCCYRSFRRSDSPRDEETASCIMNRCRHDDLNRHSTFHRLRQKRECYHGRRLSAFSSCTSHSVATVYTGDKTTESTITHETKNESKKSFVCKIGRTREPFVSHKKRFRLQIIIAF